MLAIPADRLLATFLLLCLMSSATPLFASDQLPFALYQAKQLEYPNTLSFDAKIEATRRATVSSETSGRISEINFDVDDVVEKDSILIRITDTKHRAQLSAVEANVSEAQAQYYVALSEFKRIEGVYKKQLVSKSDFDKAEASLKAAEQRLSAAKARLNETLEQFRYTVIRAPYSGIVAERHVEVGEIATVGKPLMTGFSLSELRAVTYIPQSSASIIRNHREASIVFDDHSQAPLYSSQVVVYPDADPVTHTYKVRVKLPQVPEGVFPGQWVKIKFKAGAKQQIRIPLSAVLEQSELKSVYIVDENNKLTLRQIRLGKRHEDNMVVVLAGLDDGERIAADPVRAAVYYKENK